MVLEASDRIRHPRTDLVLGLIERGEAALVGGVDLAYALPSPQAIHRVVQRGLFRLLSDGRLTNAGTSLLAASRPFAPSGVIADAAALFAVSALQRNLARHDLSGFLEASSKGPFGAQLARALSTHLVELPVNQYSRALWRELASISIAGSDEDQAKVGRHVLGVLSTPDPVLCRQAARFLACLCANQETSDELVTAIAQTATRRLPDESNPVIRRQLQRLSRGRDQPLKQAWDELVTGLQVAPTGVLSDDEIVSLWKRFQEVFADPVSHSRAERAVVDWKRLGSLYATLPESMRARLPVAAVQVDANDAHERAVTRTASGPPETG